MAAAGAVHVAVRGLGTKEEVESWAGKIKSRKQSASFLDDGDDEARRSFSGRDGS